MTWVATNGGISNTGTSRTDVIWTATSGSNGYKGSVQAKLNQLINGKWKPIAESNIIEVTIKSIKHLKPDLSPNFGGQWTLSPCNSGLQRIDATDLIVPGTGTVNAEHVTDYQWVIPAGWSINGQPSNGTTPILASKSENISYPANGTDGTIKVRGYHAVSGCSGGIQTSKWSDAIVVKRTPTLKLTSDKEWLFCGDTSPVTYTVTATNMQLPCALYYWNNSSTSTTSNTFTYTPDGVNDFTVTVRVVYGSGQQPPKSKTVVYKVIDPDNTPVISGSNTICDSGTEYYQLTNIPSNYYVKWACSSNVQLLSPQGSNPAEFKKNGPSGNATIKAQIITNCGNWPANSYTNRGIWAGDRTKRHFSCNNG